MNIFKILVLLIFATSCRTKYDISQAVEVLPSHNHQETDYTLDEIPITASDENQLINLTDVKISQVAKLKFLPFAVVSNNEFIYALGNKNISIIDFLSNKNTVILHEIKNPTGFALAENFIVVYNLKKFSVFDSTTLEKLFEEKLEVQGFASKFVCKNNLCFAISTDGEIIEISLTEKTLEKYPLLQKQSVILNKLYTPAIVENYFIFVANNTNLGIFDINSKQITSSVPFVEDESSSIFDINLVQEINVTSSNIITPYTNGINVFSFLYGKPLWNKKIVANSKMSLFGDYTIFYNSTSKKIIALHTEKGTVKWYGNLKEKPLGIFINYETHLVVLTKSGIHLFDSQTGEKLPQEQKHKFNASNVIYTFAHGDTIYYVKNNKVFSVK